MNKIVLNILMGIGLLWLLNGCGTPTPPPQPLYKLGKTVKEMKGNYYRYPHYSESRLLFGDDAWVMNTVSTNELKCKKDSLFVMNKNRSTLNKVGRVWRDYLSILSDAEKKDKSRTIYKPNSKEYNNLLKTMTRLARSDMMRCYSPMSRKEVRKYKAKQERQRKIDNDPRVIAARAQASAASYNRTMAILQAKQKQETSNSSPTRYKAPTYNFPSNNNIGTKKSSNTYYMHSDGTSTNKVGNTYFHSDGTTTIGF